MMGLLKRRDENAVGLSVLAWWLVLFAASVAMSKFLAVFKSFTLEPTFSGGGILTGVTALMVFLIGTLVYDMYSKEKVKGRLKRHNKLFEWLFARQYPTLKITQPEASQSNPQEEDKHND